MINSIMPEHLKWANFCYILGYLKSQLEPRLELCEGKNTQTDISSNLEGGSHKFGIIGAAQTAVVGRVRAALLACKIQLQVRNHPKRVAARVVRIGRLLQRARFL